MSVYGVRVPIDYDEVFRTIAAAPSPGDALRAFVEQEQEAATEAPRVLRNCDTCTHDRGRICALTSSVAGDVLSAERRAIVAWCRENCDDETLRPLYGRTGCPGYEPRNA